MLILFFEPFSLFGTLLFVIVRSNAQYCVAKQESNMFEIIVALTTYMTESDIGKSMFIGKYCPYLRRAFTIIAQSNISFDPALFAIRTSLSPVATFSPFPLCIFISPPITTTTAKYNL